MNSKRFMITALALIALIVYLFVSAPPPLPDKETNAGQTIAIERVFAIAEAENDVVRGLWTKEIVGDGQKVGLAFAEDWRREDIDAGPLPALFLRETAASLEKNPIRLSLFLGSDFPINDANRFEGKQIEAFQLIKENQEPQFFYAEDTQLHTAMFSDLALVQPCVTCHNEHSESPKLDWQLNEVMGATTWSYPAQSVTLDELIHILSALRKGFRDAYAGYLAKVATFAEPPKIGEKWPREGYYLPTEEAFMEEAIKRSSTQTLDAILNAIGETNEREATLRLLDPSITDSLSSSGGFSD